MAGINGHMAVGPVNDTVRRTRVIGLYAFDIVQRIIAFPFIAS